MNIKDLLKDAYREGMTVAEIEAALEGIEMPTDGSAEIDRLRAALTKSNSEAADYKKQLREKMSADEIKAKEDAESREKLQSDYDALLRKVTLSENKAKLLALGYGEALAESTAEAMVDGDLDTVFANQKKHLEAVAKKIREDVLKDTPKPEGGNGSDTMTKEKFSKMTVAEQYQFSVDHPEEYKKLYESN
jgi:hypothetical protein